MSLFVVGTTKKIQLYLSRKAGVIRQRDVFGQRFTFQVSRTPPSRYK